MAPSEITQFGSQEWLKNQTTPFFFGTMYLS
jgi:hypothetical protein